MHDSTSKNTFGRVTHFQSKDREHQHYGGRVAGRNAVSSFNAAHIRIKVADPLFFLLSVTVTQSTKLGIDVNRHKEIIIKAVSAILLLYLKHFKINHVYQFEVMSQHLVFANCIPLVLKFFNQNLLGYVGSKNV